MATTTELISSSNDLLASHAALLARVRESQRTNRAALRTVPSPPQELLDLSPFPSPQHSPEPSPPSSPQLLGQQIHSIPSRGEIPVAKRTRAVRYPNYVPEEETIRNDYSQRYVDGGEWPQNWVLGAEPEHRFEEYPKQQRLLTLKKASVQSHSLPPLYLPLSSLSSLHPAKFDVILIDPPFSSSFTWDTLQDLPIPALSADPSFVFLWVGSGAGEGLERGREVLGKWGFRRCEDVVWCKTNVTSNAGPGGDPPTTSLLTRTKQHCLIGIRGTVRRSTDSWFVHCNVDTDVIIWEGDAQDPMRKPPEMYTLIENFCLGTRRLELFGRARSSLRRGWVTVLVEGDETRVRAEMAPDIEVGQQVPGLWEREGWEAGIRELAGAEGRPVVPSTAEIDNLRPKSPVRGGSSNHHQQGQNHVQGQGQMFNQGMGVGVGMNPMNAMAMGMNNMGGMGNMGMMGMGRGMAAPMNNMNMSNMGVMGPMGNMSMGNMGMGNMGMGMGMGMGRGGQMNMNPMMMQNQMMGMIGGGNPGMMGGAGGAGMEGMWPGMQPGMQPGMSGMMSQGGMGVNGMGMMGMGNMQAQQGF
ncbi:hypothetical protein HWV62_36316, partial [Athelia sp. TMB]